MKAARIAVAVALLGAIAGCAGERGSAPPDTLAVETLLHRSIAAELAPGREVLVQTIELPPHAEAPRHWHPGEEYIHVLQGEAEVRIDGQEPFVAGPGATVAIPFRAWHSATAGPRGARALIFRVHTRGEPIRYAQEDARSGK